MSRNHSTDWQYKRYSPNKEMRLLIVLALATVAFGSSLPRSASTKEFDENVWNRLEDEDNDVEDSEVDFAEIAPRLDLSTALHDGIQKFQEGMPRGFADLGLPPLAPLEIDSVHLNIEKGVLKSLNNLHNVRIDGFNDFNVNEAKINILKKKINLDINFFNIQASAVQYETDTILDALDQLGISVQYEGDGSLNFGLRNLRVQVAIRYKAPLLWGSIQVTSMQTYITLEKFESKIGGFAGDGAINRFVNSQIEKIVENAIVEKSDEISDFIAELLIPRINKVLKGNTIWDVIDRLLSKIRGNGNQ